MVASEAVEAVPTRCSVASSGIAPPSSTAGGREPSAPTRLSLMAAGLYDGGAVTATTQSSEGLRPDGPTGAEATPFSPEPGATRIEVGLGRRVMVVSDLLLTPEATPTSTAVSAEVARALNTWDGPGILIIAGNLFDFTD